MIFPDKTKYLEDAQSFSIVPVWETIGADFETPLSIFVKAGGSFLLESVERGDHVGRYSFIAKGQLSTITLCPEGIEICESLEAGQERRSIATTQPLEEIRAYLAKLRSPVYEGLPPFFGGAIGYLGYEVVRHFEAIPVHPPEDGVPDGILVIPEVLLAYDSVQRTISLIATTMPGRGAQAEYERAMKAIGDLKESLRLPLRSMDDAGEPRPLTYDSPVKQEEFIDNVRRCQRYIRAGEIIQVVISQPFSVHTHASPFAIYQRLRHINPSPYLYYLDFGAFSLIGSSPEVMVKVQGRELLIKPIAGTRPRGASLAEDARLAQDLLADEKERAEHVMLVDLARNDLGRVAVAGSVEVSDFMSIEKYSHVMHLVSTVKAELDPAHDVFDVIRATFPAGTLTGAPKIRAMEIISEMEGRRRGPYGGMVCYLGFNGSFDSCITIRTIVMKGQQAWVQAGAGIVADSLPQKEFEETLQKAHALFLAIEMASEGGEHDPAH